MKESNYAENYDIWTGKSTAKEHTHYGGIHTGKAFEPARRLYCGNDEKNFPCPLILFYDKTHLDLHGSLACSPVIAWIGIFNEAASNNVKFSRVFGYVPNLSYGKSKKDKQPSHEKLQDEHDCLKQIMNQLMFIHQEGGIQATILGRDVNIVPWIHLVTGDTSGHNDLCGHFNGGAAKYPFRSCKCLLDDMDNPKPKCVKVTLADIEKASDKKALNAMSKHKIQSCFDGVPLSDPIHGIMGISPPEMLHVAGAGIFKYMLECVADIIGPNETNANDKCLFDMLHEKFAFLATRQSEKDFPRVSRRNGVLDGTKMSAKERVGNLVIVLMISDTKEGKRMLTDGLKRNRQSLDNFQRCLKLMLSFYHWIHLDIRKKSLRNAKKLVVEMLTLLKRIFARQNGNMWKIPKFHAWATILKYVELFGSAAVFDGGRGERFLKSDVKDLSHNTQKVPSKFVEQLSKRKFEQFVTHHGYTYGVAPVLNLDIPKPVEDIKNRIGGKGKYNMQFGACDHHGRGCVSVTWRDEKRQRCDTAVHEYLKLALRKFAVDHSWNGAFDVTGYTSYRKVISGYEKPVKFHANESVHGHSWYDWCMLQFDGQDLVETTCPCKIIGFIKYRTPGCPTPNLINDMKLSPGEIEDDSLRDKTTYVVVHAAKEYVPLHKMEKEFTTKFELGDIRKCLYVVDIKTILLPLFVLEDGIDNICSLPYGKWDSYFNNKMKSL